MACLKIDGEIVGKIQPKTVVRNFEKPLRARRIVYYEPRRIMRVITRRATMLAGDRSQGIAEARSVLRAF